MPPLTMTVLTVFRSRLRPGVESAYRDVANEMSRLVRLVDGFIDEKFYEAPDGERVTIARFTDLKSEQAWASNPDHLAAHVAGKTSSTPGMTSRSLKSCTATPTTAKAPDAGPAFRSTAWRRAPSTATRCPRRDGRSHVVSSDRVTRS